MAVAIGIDIGGTFTDIVVLGTDGPRLYKFPSTPDDPARGVVAALEALIARGNIAPGIVERIVHGSTVATNALLEGKLGKTALVTTDGFRDVLEIGRQNRPSLYDLFFTRPEPIVPRELRFEVPERVGSDGSVVRPLDREAVVRLLPTLREAGIQAVAVCFLFSFLHPDHEREAGEVLAGLGVPVTLSSDLLPEFREYERTSTTVINAALRPVVGSYLSSLEEGAARLDLPARWPVMQSSGAIAHAATAQRDPVRILLSGPAGGVEGARQVGLRSGFPDLITLDMGGTSCDVALVQGGTVGRTVGGAIGGYPVALPMADIHTIGAGGGSLARLDAGRALRVGPESAGAAPGPACYGRGGTEPTVTDAHLVLGHLLPEFPLGGLPRLDLDAARRAVGRIADPLGIAVEAAALGILKVADAAMERAIRVISVERGHDPRGFALLAFGGAGPLHAVSLARRLGIPKVLVPPTAGVLSALGLLLAEVGHETGQGVVRPLRSVPVAELAGLLDRLQAQAQGELVSHGAPREAVRFAFVAALRYAGQAHELDIPIALGYVPITETQREPFLTLDPSFRGSVASQLVCDERPPAMNPGATIPSLGELRLPGGRQASLRWIRGTPNMHSPGDGPTWIAELEGAFHAAHAHRYGHAAPDETVELVAVRVRASVPPPEADVRPAFAPAPELPATCAAWFDRSGPVAARVVHRADLDPGAQIEGPAIILGPDATTLLPPRSRATADEHATLIVEVG